VERTEALILKLTWKFKGPKTSEAILEEKTAGGCVTRS
jgi:hypothetical protein